MRIKGLTPFLLKDLKDHSLKNSTVVIDGQSIFYSMYKNANIPYAFGCESDKFADYIKRYLYKFKTSNLKCIFVFKGQAGKKCLHYSTSCEDNRLNGRNYDSSKDYDDVLMPIFTKNIWFQVLDDMGFKYVVCNDDYVTECIALALKLSCPLIGNNIKYFFSQVQYIPESTTVLDKDSSLLKCRTYTISSFLTKCNMTEEKIILFIMLTDQHELDTNIFRSFYVSNGLLSRYDNVIFTKLFEWIARRSTEQALNEVFSILSKFDQALFIEKKTDLENLMLKRKNTDTIMTLYVTDENKAKFTQSDPDWFEKGVFFDHIAIPYINLYRNKVINASNFIEDYEQENSKMFSIDILKYAFDLLTNFKGGPISLEHEISSNYEGGRTLKYEHSIRKPDYEATLSVFENGWDDIKQLNLFEHFVTESLQSFDFDRLNRAPADCKLLLIALVYFSRKKPDVKLEIYSILLSYVMLSVVVEKRNKDCDKETHAKKFISDEMGVPNEKPFIDSFTDQDLVTATDCDIAWSLMNKYFDLRKDELCYIFNRQVLHPLVEFQCCLRELNYLNRLCGTQFARTVYSRTYNGTFVYRILYATKRSGCQDGFQFIKDKLSSAPTVLAFLSGIVGIYESIMYEY